MAVKRNYRINLRNYGNPPAIMVSQYDENYDLVFEVYDGVVPATGLNAYTVKLVGRQPGEDPALKYEFTGTVSGMANNILSFTIDTTMTGRAGKGTAEIVILDTTNDVKFASFNLPVYVEKAAVPDDAIDADVERAQEIADEVQEIVDTAAAEVKGEAEAWAVGQRDGVDVPSTDPAYENNAKYYAEQAQEIADSIGIDATLSVAGKAADAKKVGDEISAIKEDLNVFRPTATAEDVGKALIVKIVADGVPTEFEYGETGDANAVPFPESPESKYGTSGQVLETLGDGTTRWKSVEPADPSVIESAVTDWLDDHPEATTTVQDGSITEAKLAMALVPTLKNNYVTPEMFGAVGDGTTDDTQAIKDMFASGATQFYFPSAKYRVTGGINVNIADSIIDFGGYTELELSRSYDVRDFDYVIAFSATNITTLGRLHVDANSSVNVGIWLSRCAGSNFDILSCNLARVWGICSDSANASLGGMRFNRLEATACGAKINAVGKCTSTDHMEITGILSSSDLTEAAIRSMFDSKYGATRYVLDDSGKALSNGGSGRMSFGTSDGITLDLEDHTKGYFTVNYGRLTTSYNDGDNGRAIFIPFGGGVRLEPSRSEGIYQITYISTMRCPIGLALNMQYGGVVGKLVSQYDTICMSSVSLNAVIEYMYTEAVGTGFAYTEKNNRIYLIAPNTNTNIEVINPFVGVGRFPFYQENEIPVQQQNNPGLYSSILTCSSFISNRKLNTVNVANGSTAWGFTINEYSQREYTIHARGYNGDNVKLDLLDVGATRKNMFSPVTLYVQKYGDVGDYEPFTISLTQNLIDNGYSINGGVNNKIQFSSADYNRNMKVTIVLFNKTFYVMAEALTYIQDMSLNT